MKGVAAGSAAASPASTSTSPYTGGFLVRRKDEKKQKSALKEKIVDIYESFFQGHDPSKGNPHFWEELLLLKLNVPFLERCVLEATEEQLLQLKPNINNIFENCVRALHEDNKLRVYHAMQTLCTLLRCIFTKKFTNFGYDIINILSGIEKADDLFQDMICSVQALLCSERSRIVLKSLALKLLLTIVTATDNIHQNTLLEYFMLDTTNVFPTILRLINDHYHPTPNKEEHEEGKERGSIKTTENGGAEVSGEKTSLALTNGVSTNQPIMSHHQRQQHYLLAFDAVFLLIVLLNYRKYESKNPYMRQMTALKHKGSLQALAGVISTVCSECNKQYASLMPSKSGGGFFSAIGGFFGSVFSSGPTSAVSLSPNNTGAVLLSFYELMYLNSHSFMFCLIEPNASPRANGGVGNGQQQEELVKKSQNRCPPVLEHFFTFCSYIFQDVKDQRSVCYAKLCLIILSCVFEDDAVNDILHDPQYQCNAAIFQKQLKKQSPETNDRPMVCTVLDILIQFMRYNLKKKLAVDLYCKAIGVLRRIICYEKNQEKRLNFAWRDLWDCLFTLIKFISLPDMFERADILNLCVEITTVFNLFITYGDIFLPQPSDYDVLYYEIIRESKTLETFYYYVDRYDSSNNLVQHLDNISTIIRHFTTKIDQWEAAHPERSITTPAQVIDIIKNNYESLKLTLQDDLDHYEHYLENPKEVPFFRSLVRTIVCDYKQSIHAKAVEDSSSFIPTEESLFSSSSSSSDENNKYDEELSASLAAAGLRNGNGDGAIMAKGKERI
ncbi:Armadillo-like helical domain-containing protein 3 [Balamuthia mandrillaris]